MQTNSITIGFQCLAKHLPMCQIQMHTQQRSKNYYQHMHIIFYELLSLLLTFPLSIPPLQQWSNGAIPKHACWCSVPHRFQNAIYIKMYPHRSERSLSPPLSDLPTEYIHCIPKYAYIFMGICITM